MSTATDVHVPSLITTGLVVVSVVFLLLSLSAILLRFQARHLAKQQLLADDWWVIVAWVSTLAMSINVWVFSGLAGVDHYKIDPVLGTSRSIEVSISVVKISILLLYKRIFSTKAFKIAVWIGIVVIVIWGFVFFFLVLFQSDPVSGSWTGEGRLVIDSTSLGLAQIGTSIVLDLAVLIYPIPMIHGLHLSTKRKIQVGLIFWLGAFCCIAAAARMYIYHRSIAQVQSSSSYNLIFLLSTNLIFQFLEANCSIIAACLPCFAPLVVRARSVDSLLRSIKSVISVNSQRSKETMASGSRSPSKTGSIQERSAELDQRNGGYSTNSWADEKSRTDEEHGVPGDRIRVTRAVEVRESPPHIL